MKSQNISPSVKMTFALLLLSMTVVAQEKPAAEKSAEAKPSEILAPEPKPTEAKPSAPAAGETKPAEGAHPEKSD